MSKIRIVTDSSITIEPELVKKYNITDYPIVGNGGRCHLFR